MYYRSQRQRKEYLLFRKQARVELMVAIMVVALVIAAIAVFLLIYHDFPFRLSGAA